MEWGKREMESRQKKRGNGERGFQGGEKGGRRGGGRWRALLERKREILLCPRIGLGGEVWWRRRCWSGREREGRGGYLGGKRKRGRKKKKKLIKISTSGEEEETQNIDQEGP